ncbi:MAG: HNH endonuclease [Deltaproteobacteria bacterium]|nr:HNH endonuclease [Deltaproteobacteria bacterium]
MSDWIEINKDDRHIRREREKARQLRQTQYWQRLLQQGICHYCGRKFSPAELTMDHVVPLARGGKSVRGNVVVCCRECNSRKKYKTPVEMILEEL